MRWIALVPDVLGCVSLVALLTLPRNFLKFSWRILREKRSRCGNQVGE